MRGVRKGGFFSTSSSACGLAGNLLALDLEDLSLWPDELCGPQGKRCFFAFFFAGFQAAFYTVKMTSKSSHMAKSTTIVCLVLLFWSYCPCCDQHIRGFGAASSCVARHERNPEPGGGICRFFWEAKICPAPYSRISGPFREGRCCLRLWRCVCLWRVPWSVE